MDFDKELFKQKLLNTFKAFITFCEDYDVHFFASCGTAIGAVRHKGMIPWDDDIDVYMIRDQYEKFLSLRHKLINSGYEIKDIETPNYNHAFAKFCDANTTIWEKSSYKFVIGVWIDIFPLDYIDGSYSDIDKQLVPIQKAWSKYLCTTRTINIQYLKDLFNDYGIKAIPRLLFHLFAKAFYSQEEKREALKSTIKMTNQSGGPYLICYFHTYPTEREVFNVEWFSKSINVEFEGFSIPIAIGYDMYLRKMYGDYMQLPPVEKRISHHNYFYVNLEKRVDIDNK